MGAVEQAGKQVPSYNIGPQQELPRRLERHAHYLGGRVRRKHRRQESSHDDQTDDRHPKRADDVYAWQHNEALLSFVHGRGHAARPIRGLSTAALRSASVLHNTYTAQKIIAVAWISGKSR